jgi:hypothetical protein
LGSHELDQPNENHRLKQMNAEPSTIQPPTDPKTEVAAAIVKGAISAVPFVGGVISEVGNLYLNPLEKRKQQWFIEVSNAIEEIRIRYNLLPESLQSDDRFISFLYQATFIALKSHQREKIDALKSALVLAAKPEQVSDDLLYQFLRYIDELSPTHLMILACLHKQAGRFKRMEKLEQVYSKIQSCLGARIERTAFRSFMHDLDSRFLLRLGDLEDFGEYETKQIAIVTEGSTIRPLKVTSLGRSFLSFIDGKEESPQQDS